MARLLAVCCFVVPCRAVTLNSTENSDCANAVLNREKLETLFQLYRPRLVGLAGRVLHDSHLAEDAVNDVFVTLLDRNPQDVKDPLGFLLTCTRNRSMRMLHRGVLQKAGEDTGGRQQLEEREARARETKDRLPAEEAEIWTIVQQELEALPTHFRVVLEMRLEGMQLGEIEKTTGLNYHTVKTHILRGRAELRRKLESRGIVADLFF